MKINKFFTAKGKYAAVLLGLILVIAFPFLLSYFQIELLSKFLSFALAGVSYDLIWGYAGISNFGHAVFFGLGAYGFGLSMKYFSGPWATGLAFLSAILLPMGIGILLSLFLHHGNVKGSFFAVVTMCLCVVFENIASSWTEVTGGMNGLYGFQSPSLGIPGVAEVNIQGKFVPFYTVVTALVIVLVILTVIMKRRNFGKVISALKNDENRLTFLGYNSNLLKTVIFAISCAVAGLAGALYVPVGTISPSLLGMSLSINIVVWVAVGGRRSLWGPVVGAVLVGTMEQMLSGVLLDFWLLIIGVFFILIVLFWREGVAGLIRKMGETARNAVHKKKGGKRFVS